MKKQFKNLEVRILATAGADIMTASGVNGVPVSGNQVPGGSTPTGGLAPTRVASSPVVNPDHTSN